MTDAQPLLEADRLSLDGLDNMFSGAREAQTVSIEGQDTAGQSGQPLEEELTVADAAKILGQDVKYVLALIREGQLCATRNKETRQWVVSGPCVRGQLAEQDNQTIKHAKQEAVETIPVWDIGPQGFNCLLEKLHHMQQQLNDTHYRIGYLESQLLTYAEKVQQLPDLQAQAARLIQSEQESDELRLKLVEVTAQLQKARQPVWSRFCLWLAAGIPK